jgi:hypothetical protein
LLEEQKRRRSTTGARWPIGALIGEIVNEYFARKSAPGSESRRLSTVANTA